MLAGGAPILSGIGTHNTGCRGGLRPLPILASFMHSYTSATLAFPHLLGQTPAEVLEARPVVAVEAHADLRGDVAAAAGKAGTAVGSVQRVPPNAGTA
jgi:hypothetical protein